MRPSRAPHAESIEVMRRRARHRLIGAAVLVLCIVGCCVLLRFQRQLHVLGGKLRRMHNPASPRGNNETHSYAEARSSATTTASEPASLSRRSASTALRSPRRAHEFHQPLSGRSEYMKEYVLETLFALWFVSLIFD